jgi:hypothetical protein
MYKNRAWFQNPGAPAKNDKAVLHTAAVEHTKTSNLNQEPQAVSHNMGDKSPPQHIRFTNQEMLNQEAIDLYTRHSAAQLPPHTQRVQSYHCS